MTLPRYTTADEVAAASQADALGIGWTDRAACVGADIEVFFVPSGHEAREARALCGGCEVRARCLEFALERRLDDGVFGGLSADERQQVRRERAAAAQAAA